MNGQKSSLSSKIRPLRGAPPFFPLRAAPPPTKLSSPKFLSQQRIFFLLLPRNYRRLTPERATARSSPLSPRRPRDPVALLRAAGRRGGDRPRCLIPPVLVNPSSLSEFWVRPSVPVFLRAPDRCDANTAGAKPYCSFCTPRRSFLECHVCGFVRCYYLDWPTVWLGS